MRLLSLCRNGCYQDMTTVKRQEVNVKEWWSGFHCPNEKEKDQWDIGALQALDIQQRGMGEAVPWQGCLKKPFLNLRKVRKLLFWMQSTSRKKRDQWFLILINANFRQSLQLYIQAKREEERFLRYWIEEEVRLETKPERWSIKHLWSGMSIKVTNVFEIGENRKGRLHFGEVRQGISF